MNNSAQIKPTLVVLAAGMGTRFGGGKQTAIVGINDEYIIDYSLYDAWQAGFGKAVLIIRPEMENDMREHFDDKLDGKMELVFAFQKDDFPYPQIQNNIKRQKPWGTAHAILCLEGIVNEPFAVINADDYYGPSSFEIVARHLLNDITVSNYSMVGFEISKTIPETGVVNRGVCRVDDSKKLQYIEESKARKNNIKTEVSTDKGKSWTEVDANTPVSMNLWGYHQNIIPGLKEVFFEFLHNMRDSATEEFLLPTVIYDWIQNEKINVVVLKSSEKWLGMTYKEDQQIVKEAMIEKIEKGEYPAILWN